MLITMLHHIVGLADASPQKMKNIHYAGQGYDIVRGNPQCSNGCARSGGFDPGFMALAV